MIADTIQRSPRQLAPVYYDTPPEQRLAIRLWAQSYAARLDRIIGGYIRAPAAVGRSSRDMS